MSKGFWGIIAAVIIIFAGIVAFSGSDQKNSSTNKSSSSNLSQHFKGEGTSGVTLTEYGDFQCPACEAYEPTVEAVRGQYGDKLKFQFRNFPLTSIHRNAFAAARAAEAANLQGKYWEMHDALYQSSNWQIWTQVSNPNPYFDQYAQQLGLKVSQFKADFASSKVNDIINADMNEGNRLGIDSTPTFFVNGKKTDIKNSADEFKKVLDAAIAAEKKS